MFYDAENKVLGSMKIDESEGKVTLQGCDTSMVQFKEKTAVVRIVFKFDKCYHYAIILFHLDFLKNFCKS